MNDLADFVRVRRLRMDPASRGIDAGAGRRRVRGLRREELGQLAGLSADWIARLEQGRTKRLSRAAAERLARVLGLDEVEGRHLLALCGQPDAPAPAPAPAPAADRLSTTVERVIAAQGQNPAYAVDPHGDVLFWNAAADRVFGPFDRGGRGASNSLRWMFLSVDARHRFPDWEEIARRMVAQFRHDYDRREKTAADAEMIGALRSRSADFARLWAEHAVLERSGARKLVRHPEYGDLTFDLGSFRSFERPDLTMTVFLPVPHLSPGLDALLRDLDEARVAAEGDSPVLG